MIEKTAGEILPTIVQDLENVLKFPPTAYNQLLHDCLTVIKYFKQPVEPVKTPREDFHELHDVMHESLAVDGEFAGIYRFENGGNGPGENKLAMTILDALAIAKQK